MTSSIGAALIALALALPGPQGPPKGRFFDRDTRTFRPQPGLADLAGVKGISHHPVSGEVAYVQAEGENWWAERIHLLNPSGTVHLPGERLYKARWIRP